MPTHLHPDFAVPEYRRYHVPGGTFFFTLVTFDRRPVLTEPRAYAAIRQSFRAVRRMLPFRIDAAVVLPDHLHVLITLPDGETDFSTRVGQFKRRVSKAVAASLSELPSRHRRREAEFWQRRFWEHAVRDEAEFAALAEYIHYNPVKHGHARCSHAWPHGSFRVWARRGWIERHWGCQCGEPRPPPAFDLGRLVGE